MAESAVDFFTQEAVSGELLSERIAGGPLAPDEALRLAIEIGAALNRAHSDGQVHGGLCPLCVVLTEEGVIAGCLEKEPGKRRQRVQNAVIELKLAAPSRFHPAAPLAAGRPKAEGQRKFRRAAPLEPTHAAPAHPEPRNKPVLAHPWA